MSVPYYQDDSVTLYHGDCLDVLAKIADRSVDSVVTDPPYGLEFMGKDWDRPWAVSVTNGVGYAGRQDLPLPAHRDNRNANCRACGGRQRGAKRCACATPKWDRDPADDMRAFQQWCELWAAECLRVLKPGGHLVSFGGSRTWHRLACAVEDAGFEVRDSIAWLYGSGFPKSRNLDGDWEGWGTALKPAFEPIVVGRKPFPGTVAANVLDHGTGALNIDACRIGDDVRVNPPGSTRPRNSMGDGWRDDAPPTVAIGRWPTNVVLDEGQASALDEQTGVTRSRVGKPRGAASGDGWGMTATGAEYDDQGGASRFFPVFRYEAKAPTAERPSVGGVQHPTVKPLDLMRWLVRLVTPPGGVVLDPFAGSGTTAEACVHEHMRCITIEREAAYLPLIVGRLSKPLEVGFDFGAGAS